jgi:hypothetical protein
LNCFLLIKVGSAPRETDATRRSTHKSGGGDGGFLAGLESASFDNDNDASGSPTLLAASRVVSSRVVL